MATMKNGDIKWRKLAIPAKVDAKIVKLARRNMRSIQGEFVMLIGEALAARRAVKSDAA